MVPVKFVHCADVHLDMPFSSIGSDDGKSSARRQDLREVMGRITCTAREEDAGLLLISGDLYEHGYAAKSTINYINQLFKEIPDTRIFIIPGNHDPYTQDSYYRNYNWSSNVFILCGDRPYVFLKDLNICIYGLGLNGNMDESPAPPPGQREWENPDVIRIIMLHGTVDMNIGGNAWNPVSSKNLESLDADYIALGHFHKPVLALGRRGRIFNPGSPEPLGFDEVGPHGFIAGEIFRAPGKKSEIKTRFISSNKRYYRNMELDITDIGTDEEIIRGIRGAISGGAISGGAISGEAISGEAISGKNAEDNRAANISGDLFSVTLKGRSNPGFSIDIPQIINAFKEEVFFLKIKDGTLPAYDIPEFAKESGLRGLFAKKILDRLEKAVDDRERSLVIKAFYYGIEALEGEKLDTGK